MGTSPARVAIAFVLEHPLLAVALVGATSPGQLDETLAAVALHAGCPRGTGLACGPSTAAVEPSPVARRRRYGEHSRCPS